MFDLDWSIYLIYLIYLSDMFDLDHDLSDLSDPSIWYVWSGSWSLYLIYLSDLSDLSIWYVWSGSWSIYLIYLSDMFDLDHDLSHLDYDLSIRSVKYFHQIKREWKRKQITGEHWTNTQPTLNQAQPRHRKHYSSTGSRGGRDTPRASTPEGRIELSALTEWLKYTTVARNTVPFQCSYQIWSWYYVHSQCGASVETLTLIPTGPENYRKYRNNKNIVRRLP